MRSNCTAFIMVVDANATMFKSSLNRLSTKRNYIVATVDIGGNKIICAGFCIQGYADDIVIPHFGNKQCPYP